MAGGVNTVTGVSAPSVQPAEMTVDAPRSRVPGCRVTPSPEMRSGSMSSAMSTDAGLGMCTPLSISVLSVASRWLMAVLTVGGGGSEVYSATPLGISTSTVESS